MPVTINRAALKVKNSNGTYVSVDAVSEGTTAEKVAQINQAALDGVRAINTKAGEVTSQLANAGEMEAMVAPPFASNTAYKAGQYVIHTNSSNVNKLYRFNVDHAANTAWSDSEVSEVKLGNDVTDLKSAFDTITEYDSEEVTGETLDGYTISIERNEVIQLSGYKVNRYFLESGKTYFVNAVFFGTGEYTPGAVTIQTNRIYTPVSSTYVFINYAYDDGVYRYKGATIDDVDALKAKIPQIAKQNILQGSVMQDKLYRTLADGENKCTYSASGGSIIWQNSNNYLTVELSNEEVFYVYFGTLSSSAIRGINLVKGSSVDYYTFSEIIGMSSTWYKFGIEISKISANSVKIRKYSTDGDNTSIYVTLLVNNVESGTSYIKVDESIIPEWLDYNRNPKTVYVAASDASEAEKKYADYVCTGTNDQSIINSALIAIGKAGTVYLSSGTFNIDNFDNYYQSLYAAIHRHAPDENWDFDVCLKGMGKFGNGKTILNVTSTFNENIGNVSEVSIIGGYGYGSGINVEDIRIALASNQYPIVCYNGQHLGHGTLKNISASCAANSETTQATIPNEKCVGFRSYIGDDNGTQSTWESLIVVGAYTGFQLGAEHMVLTECGTRFCFYGYTFGDYDIILGANFIHPVTLINCCDEHSARLPKFVKCGDMVNEHTIDHPKQEITMISFNIEKWPGDWGTYWKCAEEVNPGDFCGRIEYTLNGQSTSGGGEDWSSHSNHYSAQFWETGSGINFNTVNMTHRKGGTSALRRLYYPNYMQQYFDTDAGKLLTCIDPANKTWVDADGNVVS